MEATKVQGMPLPLLREGESAEVVGVRGTAESRQRLAELGFVAGAVATVVTRAQGGVVVAVKGARLALGAGMANRVTVVPIPAR